MFKKILLLSAFSAFSFSSVAAEINCPAPASIVTTGQLDTSDGVPGFVYCSPSAKECQWKGLDPLSDTPNKVSGVINEGGKPTHHNGLTYCDYELKNGNQIRLSLEK